MGKAIKINMMDHKGEQGEKEFLFKDCGIKAFQYNREISLLGQKYGSNPFELTIKTAEKYFPLVIGKERFKIEGLDDNIKFEEILEEFFMNDPVALDELVNEMGFFLYPALKNRIK